MNKSIATQLFICPICGNSDPYSIGIRNGKQYCRKCLTFRGKEADEPISEIKDAPINLTYRLSKEQKVLSKGLVTNYKNGINSLVKAVCGSGKTEIVLGSIKYAIKHGLKVGFTCPRRDVVIELYCRFKSIFKENKVTVVYGGCNDELDGDLICLTTHQLFRYNNYFDLLIMDEIDAFPYKGNEVLESFFKRALKGNFIMLSATPSEEFVSSFKKKGGIILELYTRYHKHPLPVPEIVTGNKILLLAKIVSLTKEFIKRNKPVFIFTPTIEICESIFNLLRLFVKKGNYVHSKHPHRSKVINDFKQGRYMYLVTTAVLERGVTVKDLQVIIYRADHNIYDRYSLVQIAGRVGRKKEAPEGRVIYLAKQTNMEMQKSIEDIEKSNKTLQNLL